MARVKPVNPQGVKVTVRLLNRQPGVPMVVSLPYPCAWQGQLVPRVQRVVTDAGGEATLYLPPSGELKPLHDRGSGRSSAVLYRLDCAVTGNLAFEVPATSEWTVGE